ncbi:PQQ-binding-like beta-propeller repeat protein [Novipirellula artificiosorum]|uniref:Quinoprotein ethanol dehydrogenase n=1 Tax=Novipirellula artificiosorum TaxID=2528016 RepID=A0A5C6DDR4_9BACT|nr:PQQ-binding-like beta-propeller repeat protein [Novipirellula artificiosorum]TWU34325.1 Quinoprotein ethanol dehydrogenase precursor [Novipirellula artificiosorum]
MQFSKKWIAGFVVTQILLVNFTFASDDQPYWPQFHGPIGDNISTETGLLSQWPEGGPELLWQAEGMGEGYSSVSLANGLIYTAGNIEDQTVVFALNLNGEIEWQSKCGPAWTQSFPGTRSTPTLDNDRLYFESPLGDLVCLNAQTGKQLWGKNLLKEFGGENIKWALAESPIIDGDNLICCPFGSQGSVVALDKMTGETVWAAQAVDDKAGYATPTIVEFAGRRIVLAMSGQAMVGVAADTGQLLFRYEHLTKYDVNALKPVYADGQVFISSGYKAGSEMVKLTATGSEITATRAWESKDMDNHHGGVIHLDGYIYGADSSRNWVCFDWKTGETKYTDRGVGKGSLTCADGLLYTLSEDRGRMGLVKPTPTGHELISEFTIPAGGKGKSWAHPVVCGGRLYVRHGDLLFAFNVQAPK